MFPRLGSCIVTGGSSNDTAPMGVLLLNLKATQPWIEHVVIFHDGISKKDCSIMQSILPVELVHYSFPGNSSKFNEIVKYYYSEVIFCKYECFKLLNRFDTVLWTDYDVIFQKDVRELLKPCSMGLRTLMYNEADKVGTLRRQLRYGKENIVGTRYNLDTLSIATGLFVLDRNLPELPQLLYNRSISLTEEFGDCLCLPEQAVFDMLLQDFCIVPETISWAYATHPSDEMASSASIIHAYAQPKFWNGCINKQWNAYYSQWLEMGGSKWKPLSRYSWRRIARTALFFLHTFWGK